MQTVDRRRARSAVGLAVASGRLPRANTQPCTDCKGVASEYDHYLGYEREHWLSVEPVCRLCHRHRTASVRHAGPIPKTEPVGISQIDVICSVTGLTRSYVVDALIAHALKNPPMWIQAAMEESKGRQAAEAVA